MLLLSFCYGELATEIPPMSEGQRVAGGQRMAGHRGEDEHAGARRDGNDNRGADSSDEGRVEAVLVCRRR